LLRGLLALAEDLLLAAEHRLLLTLPLGLGPCKVGRVTIDRAVRGHRGSGSETSATPLGLSGGPADRAQETDKDPFPGHEIASQGPVGECPLMAKDPKG
jgi:hypothetical protein